MDIYMRIDIHTYIHTCIHAFMHSCIHAHRDGGEVGCGGLVQVCLCVLDILLGLEYWV
jgi:hypothetical protein